MNKRLKKNLDVSNCQIVGPCSQILVVCVFSLYAFTFASCPLPPLCWNSLVWSDPSFLSGELGRNLSWKHRFCWWGSWKVFWGMCLCWLSLKGSLEWFVALEILLGWLWVGMGLCLLKHADNTENIGQIKAKIRRNMTWGCLVVKEELVILLLFIP